MKARDLLHRFRRTAASPALRGEGVVLRVLYFLVYGSIGTWMPFLGIYLEDIGFSGLQMGALSSVRPVVTIISQPLWGVVADLWGRRRALLLTMLAAALALVGFVWRGDFWFLFLWTVVYALLSTPIGTLLDSLTLDYLEKRQGLSYGRFRLWGAVGWSVVSYVVGYVIAGQDMRLMFVWGAVLMIVGWVLLLCISRESGDGEGVFGNPWRDLRPLLYNRRLLVFLALIAFVQVGGASLFSFFSIYMDRLGASQEMIGLAFGLQGMSELPVFLAAAAIVRRLGPVKTLVITFLVFAARAFFYALVSQPALVVAAQLVHGSFSLLLVASVEYVNRVVPRAWRATGQSLFWAAYMGVGGGLGGMLAGSLYDWLGVQELFFVSGCIMLAAALLAMVALREGRAGPGE